MVKRDKYEANDTTPFDQSKLQDLQTISAAIRHKMYGADVREPIAQLPDALIQALQDGTDLGQTGALAELVAARGGFETVGLHEAAQDNDIQTNAAGVKTAKSSASYAVSIAKSASSGSPRDFLENEADLKSKYPTGATGIYVTNDTGHMWFYNTAWQDIGVYQGTEVADKSVDNSKLSNEVRLNGLKSGGGWMSLNWSDGYVANDKADVLEGTLVNNKNYSVSNSVIVHTGDLLIIRAKMGMYGSMVSLWNSNGDYVQSLYDGIGSDIITYLTVPSPGYIKISNENEYGLDKVILRKYPQTYFESLPKELVGSVEWSRMPLQWESRAYIGSSKNATHPYELVQSSGLDANNRVSEPFYVSKGMMLKTNGATTSSGCVLAEFKEDGKTFVKELIVGDNETGYKSYYFDHNAYVRVGTRQSIQDSVTVTTTRVDNQSTLYDKTIDVLGDSYVDNMNDPIEYSWHYKLAQKYGMTYNNYGLHGNGLVSPDGNGTPVVDRFSEIDSKADYVLIMSGENDYTHQLPLEDFRTGIDKIIKGVAGNCTGAKMAFFTMWSRGDTENQPIPQADYAQVMVDECKKFGVPCFNSFANSDNRVWDPNFRKKYMQGDNDISHLNSAGHDRFMPRAEAFLNGL